MGESNLRMLQEAAEDLLEELRCESVNKRQTPMREQARFRRWQAKFTEME